MVKYMAISKTRHTLPNWARLPINRCNLPVEILGGLGFQQHPRSLFLDGVQSLHKDLFVMLQKLQNPEEHAQRFVDYMTVHFLLEDVAEAGASATTKRKKATYLRLLRGWFFDPDGREAAVLKGWVESRFGLSPCYHQGRLQDKNGLAYTRFMHMRTEGIYNTNALEAQLDLLYSFCQFELAQSQSHFTLYRGINRLEEFDIQYKQEDRTAILLFNNLNSFTSERDTASSFGDIILEVSVPKEKILCFPGLLKSAFTSENEFLVIGGLYHVTLSYM